MKSGNRIELDEEDGCHGGLGSRLCRFGEGGLPFATVVAFTRDSFSRARSTTVVLPSGALMILELGK